MLPIASKAGLLFFCLYAGFSRINWLNRSRDRGRLLQELVLIAHRSVPLVMLIGLFAGAIIAWQAAYQFRGLVSLNLLGGQSARIIVMEMAPVMTAMVIAGRIVAPFSSSLASKIDSGQADALSTLGIDPWRIFFMPHQLALTISLPLLSIFSNATGIIGCWYVSEFFLDIPAETFWSSIQDFFNPIDLVGGLIKSLCFGLFMGMISGYCGFYSGYGSIGIRDAGTRAFVYSALMILTTDFWLWFLLY
jgi:phospholipid/cholesterol/gamma-HCH transport system permease protein